MQNIKFESLFPILNDHQFDNEILDDHKYKLVKFIIKEYIKIKKYYTVKKYNSDKNDNLRQKLSRYIIFQNK